MQLRGNNLNAHICYFGAIFANSADDTTPRASISQQTNGNLALDSFNNQLRSSS